MVALILVPAAGCRYFIGGPFERNMPPDFWTALSVQDVPDRVLAACIRAHPQTRIQNIEVLTDNEGIMAYRFVLVGEDGKSEEVEFDRQGRPARSPR
jgi:hypothetical protein